MAFIKKTLENILGEDKFQKLKGSVWYRVGVESFTLNTFSYPIALGLELGFAKFDLSEHLQTRLFAVITNTLTGRPYGVFRDGVFEVLNIKKDSHWTKKYLGDTLAFAVVQTPLYLINMALGGAELDEMLKAAIPATLISGALGKPYGFYLDKIRQDAGLSSEQK